jgi:hypothetical protein
MSELQTKTTEPPVTTTTDATDPATTPNPPTTDPVAQSTPVAETPTEESQPTEATPEESADPAPEAAPSEVGTPDHNDQDNGGLDSDGHDPMKADMVDKAAEQNKLRIVTKALKNIERDLANVVRLLESGNTLPPKETVQLMTHTANAAATAAANTVKAEAHRVGGSTQSDGRVIEGVFDGQNMVGSDGKSYTVPANYASKSKLVEGDMLKLTITPRGSFIYKQIGPIERTRVIATLGFDQTIGEFYAANETRRWNILKASVTYYRGDPGDEVVLLVPKNAPSKWAAVENIIKGNAALEDGVAGSAPVPEAGSMPTSDPILAPDVSSGESATSFQSGV